MSGVIVERRDHVLITGGRWPPARAFSTAFTIPLSMNGPFLTERAMCLHFQLPIADSQLPIEEVPKVFKSAIGNRNLAIYFVLRSFRIIFCVRLLLRVL
jgi:hypothetical protein